MGLHEQQNLLARLYTDPKFHRTFLDDPHIAASESGLSPMELEDLVLIAPDEVKFFADSLVWKRYREVQKLLPLSANELGEQFQTLFREFSSGYTPTSVKKHLEDSLQFVSFLSIISELTELSKDVVNFESTRLKHNTQNRRYSYVRLGHDLRPLIGRDAGESVAALPRRRSTAVWLRIGKRTRFFFI